MSFKFLIFNIINIQIDPFTGLPSPDFFLEQSQVIIIVKYYSFLLLNSSHFVAFSYFVSFLITRLLSLKVSGFALIVQVSFPTHRFSTIMLTSSWHNKFV